MTLNEQDTKYILKALIPTKMEAILLVAFSFGALGLLAGLEYFEAIDSTNYQAVASDIEKYTRSALSLFDKYIGVTFLTLVFWMFVGTLVYSIIWIGVSSYNAYRNDLPDTKGLVFPRGYKRSNVIHEGIAKFSIRVVSIILFVGWAYFLVTKLLPSLINTFMKRPGENLTSAIIQIIFSTLLLACSVFIIFILSRLVLLRTRVFYK